MDKVIRIGTTPVWEGKNADVFIHIQHKDGRLSITGVEGPLRNGDCMGSCGQIEQPEIVDYAPGWNRERVDQLFAVWREWHLNDMRAGCEHQRANRAEWESVDIVLYHYRLSPEVADAIRAEEKRATESVKSGMPFQVDPEVMRLANLPRTLTTATADIPSPEYVRNGPQYNGDTYNRESETKKSSWVKESEHPRGTLSKPCPVCGYQYGSRWLHEDVPTEVLEWLGALPDADKAPAWI